MTWLTGMLRAAGFHVEWWHLAVVLAIATALGLGVLIGRRWK
jgi:hypothetical protein